MFLVYTNIRHSLSEQKIWLWLEYFYITDDTCVCWFLYMHIVHVYVYTSEYLFCVIFCFFRCGGEALSSHTCSVWFVCPPYITDWREASGLIPCSNSLTMEGGMLASGCQVYLQCSFPSHTTCNQYRNSEIRQGNTYMYMYMSHLRVCSSSCYSFCCDELGDSSATFLNVCRSIRWYIDCPWLVQGTKPWILQWSF